MMRDTLNKWYRIIYTDIDDIPEYCDNSNNKALNCEDDSPEIEEVVHDYKQVLKSYRKQIRTAKKFIQPYEDVLASALVEYFPTANRIKVNAWFISITYEMDLPKKSELEEKIKCISTDYTIRSVDEDMYIIIYLGK